ncbi:MAG: hypothetical protein A3C30_04975 [Candidatus Levybacteria bacterium RIFCSPHIGHO2_02_FULL_40_18]|nr:MAG: hypothetical protein A2869_02635 [Candidatus Levybacteria bacterium RIFCSPHIGHO2_01_FULL_40_58]OGH26427.1 MAG: hypothetical protein A3C30_04975 [Candidatus Levybacteria bacterium RIFCSPHIGHO2_02_FULL_40_18]OGH31875.1 MAG: hypothetical protein A3E43_00775 [Candidatus Levybacteria bacterium RIFCSPHIGHO2_12_FULL_40_31]OGH40508.1 MAG: hypothetical protein A2894_01280 [Candidatus Levybacteria bacterium RIFCSPLOWO2_01_FULL_40_64]OGH49268.1 MAG: hypothetical protein A3I54_01320 [Candidatus Lev
MPKSPHRYKIKYKIHHKLIMAIGIGIAVVSFWRGAWGLMDIYLFPENPTLSFSASFIIGFVILYITHYIVRELM